MTKRQKRGFLGTAVALFGLFLSLQAYNSLPIQPVMAQAVLSEGTGPPLVIESPLQLSNLHIRDGQVVILATQNGGAMLIYDEDGNDAVNNNTVFEGPAGVGRLKAMALSGLGGAPAIPSVPADPEDPEPEPSEDITPGSCTIVGQNDPTLDTAEWERCIDVLTEAGGGVLYVSGIVALNEDQDITVPVSIIGVPGTGATICQLDDAGSISWNNSVSPTALTSMSLTATAAFQDHLVVTTASNTLVRGDWFLAFSDDPITGVTHLAGFGNNPGEVHQVKEIRESTGGNDYIIFDDFIVDALTNSVSLVELPMLNGIKVEGIKFRWGGSTAPDAWSLRFNCCTNVLVTNCHWISPTHNEVQFNYAANGIISDCTFETAKAYDSSEGYHVTIGTSTNILFTDCIAYGARHVFTTQGTTRTETGSYTASAGTEFFTSAGHGHENGTLITFAGSVPSGITSGDSYYVVNKTTDTFQVATLPGGSAIDLTTGGSGTWTNRDRLGTPRNIVVSNVIAKCNGATNSTLVPFDTHAEGWGIVFDSCTVAVPSEYRAPATSGTVNSNRAFQTRSRNTVFQNCKIFGSSQVTPGFYIMGKEAKVLNCYAKNCWHGVRCLADTSGGYTDNVDGLVVAHSTFDTLGGPGVQIEMGSNHTLEHNTFINCAATTSSLNRAPIVLESTGSGFRVNFNSLDNQSANLYSIGGTQVSASELTFVGNDMTGYSTDTQAFTVNAGTNTVNAVSHGLLNGTGVRLTTSNTLPGGLSTGTTYYIINRTSSTFQLSSTSGGTTPVEITTSGTGTHNFDPTTNSGIEWRNSDASNLETEAVDNNWADD